MPSSLKERDQNLWRPSLKLSGRERRNTEMRTNFTLLVKPSGGAKYFCFKKNPKYMKNMVCECLYSGFLAILSDYIKQLCSGYLVVGYSTSGTYAMFNETRE